MDEWPRKKQPKNGLVNLSCRPSCTEQGFLYILLYSEGEVEKWYSRCNLVMPTFVFFA